jgi:hypothetical protein
MLFGLVAIATTGCAAAGPPAATLMGSIPWPPPEYRHTISTVAVRQYWRCTRPEPGLLQLDGVAANISSSDVKFLAWELAGVDAAGRSLTSQTAESGAIVLRTNEIVPFRIALRATGAEARFDLYYEYKFQEGDAHDRPLAALDWDGPVLFAQHTNRFFVRDACSETQHLAR